MTDMKKKIRVLVADDHAIVRMGLVYLLNSTQTFEVVGEAFDGADTVSKALALRPDVIVMDISMPRKNGVAATAELKERLPDAKILLLTTFNSSENISQGLRAGATGATLKSIGNDAFLKVLQSVAEGQTVITPEVKRLLADDPPLPELSPRQREILESIARGLTNKDIAVQFDISLESVKSHIKIILEKLGAASRTEAAARAQKKGLLS